MHWFMIQLYKKFNQDLRTWFFKQNIDSCKSLMYNKNFAEVLNYLNILKQSPKTIHGSTHCKKIWKLCWWQLPISKSLLVLFTSVNQKDSFQWKIEGVNTIIEFCIFELVQVPNLSLNWQFWPFEPNSPKTGVSHLKHKKVKTTIEFCIIELVYNHSQSIWD